MNNQHWTLLKFCSLFLLLTGGIQSKDPSNGISIHGMDFSPLNKEEIKDLLSEKEYLKTGTTIVGICCIDGVVLGADTRSTGGPLVMDKNKLKIHKISSRIYSCAAGTSADCDQITRKASFDLASLRIENELNGDINLLNDRFLDPISAAVISIINSLYHNKNAKRQPKAVFILGGVDNDGSALYQINSNLLPQKVSFGSLGSGSIDALAVLENSISNFTSFQNINGSDSKINGNFTIFQRKFRENIDCETAVHIVRIAVRAGIINDLGSGSHVDLCVIKKDSVQQWREELVSTWDKNRLPFMENNKEIKSNEEIKDILVDQNIDFASEKNILGEAIYKKKKRIQKIVGSNIIEDDGSDILNKKLSLNIDYVK